MRRALATVALLLVGATGCGADSFEPDGVQAPEGRAAQPEERTALAWYRALEQRRADRVIEGLSARARLPLDEDLARRLIKGTFGLWAEQTVATALYSEGSGDARTVFLRLEGGERIGSVLVYRGSLLLALPMVRQRGAWLVDDSAWLRNQVNTFNAVDVFERLRKREDST